jgi:phage replication O-like protein O
MDAKNKRNWIINYPFTATPNVVFDEWMSELGDTEFKVICAILRKTLGFHKDQDAISLSMLEEITGNSHRAIEEAVVSLEEKGLITIERTPGKSNIYRLVMHEMDELFEGEEQQPGSKGNTLNDPPGYQMPYQLGQKVATQKKQEKENLKREKEFFQEETQNGTEEKTVFPMPVVDPIEACSPANVKGISADDQAYWRAQDQAKKARTGKIVLPAGGTQQRTAADIISAAQNALGSSGGERMVAGLESYPQDVREILDLFCKLWDLAPPRAFGGKNGRSEYSDWVRCARELADACGEFDPAQVITEYHKRWSSSDKPYSVGRPGAIQKSVRAYVGEMRHRANSAPLVAPEEHINNGVPFFYV